MIFPYGSLSGNLACTIPEVITTLRGKKKLQETLKMAMEQIELIDKEITASNARKFGKSSIARAHFRNSTPNNGIQRREHTNWMIEYQQRVDAVTTEKLRQSYTFCDVQARTRSAMNTIKYLNDE